MAHLLILEDDLDLREELSDFLMSRGHQILSAGSLHEFHHCLESSVITDVAIIDRLLPDGEGHEALKALRRNSDRTGIIFLTARGALEDRLEGLRCGADHYLVKPFNLNELCEVIEALLRRVGIDWRYDARLHQLQGPGNLLLDLNALESCLFALLSNEPERVIHRDTLVEAMGHRWADFDARRLDTAISRLRSRWKIKNGCSLPLKTRHGLGYSFDFLIRKI